MRGANWRAPSGPFSFTRAGPHSPVTQVSYEDAAAYARWRGRALPTEAQWEFAARGARRDSLYEWGDTPADPQRPRANTWQGLFPVTDAGRDGYRARTAPVGCFPPNGYGLFDMSGNVWEWTRDTYTAEGDRVIKGGSFLCADNFCFRYRPSARQGGPVDGGASHVGFRTVRSMAAQPARRAGHTS